jgi:hypothetical protein
MLLNTATVKRIDEHIIDYEIGNAKTVKLNGLKKR